MPTASTATLYRQNLHPYDGFPHSPDAYSCLVHDKLVTAFRLDAVSSNRLLSSDFLVESHMKFALLDKNALVHQPEYSLKDDV
ncbi:Uncharacterised protein [Acinetobacter baumannii]|nr:Uncharacterised protein [Acinetobacter baumannii]